MMENGVNPDSGNSALSLDQGAHELASLLGADALEERRRTNPEHDAGEPELANEAHAPDHVSEDETQGDPYGEDADRSEEDAAQDVGDDEEPNGIRLKDGTEVTLDDVEEWRKGNLRDADYRRKTMEIAATRKELETRLSDIQQKSQFFDENVTFAIALAQAHLPQPPDRSLLHSDPIGYLEQKAAYETGIEQLQELVAAKQYAEQSAQVQQSAQLREMLTSETGRLVAAMPELKEPARARQFSTDLTKSIERYGFDAQDLAQVADHRLILLAKDAMAYQRIVANRSKAQAKANGATPMQVPGRRPGPNEAKVRMSKEKWDNLRRDGSLESGAAVLLDLVKG